jgi:hypothetical protein
MGTVQLLTFLFACPKRKVSKRKRAPKFNCYAEFRQPYAAIAELFSAPWCLFWGSPAPILFNKKSNKLQCNYSSTSTTQKGTIIGLTPALYSAIDGISFKTSKITSPAVRG